MLSYRHGFHAGNHGDVLKHIVLIRVLRYLTQKPNALLYIDTHAATGVTSLSRGQAQKTQEFELGISRLYGQHFDDLALDDYLTVIGQLQSGGPAVLRHYPGSAAIANFLLRKQDGLRLFERHPRDFQTLNLWAKKQATNVSGRFIKVFHSDGFAAPNAFLPPPSRRAVVLVDPSYELKTDYREVRNCVQEVLRRLASSTVIVWVPLIARLEAQQLVHQLKNMTPNWFYCHIQLENSVIHKLFGSAVVVINPPYTLKQEMTSTLGILANTLGGEQKKFQIEDHVL